MGHFGGCLEFGAILCKVNIRKEIREHPYFSPMWDAAGDALSLQKDIMSLKKEIDNGNPFNLIYLKINQGATAQEAYREIIRQTWDATYQFMHYGELIVNEFPNDPDFILYMDIIINMINGDPDLHANMERYPTATECIIPLKDFVSIDDVDEQF